MGDALFIGNTTIRLDQVGSTNDYMKSLISSDQLKAEGTLVVTSDQSAGRGHHGAVWQSEPGKNLCFSVHVNPKTKLSEQFVITQFASLSLVDLLQQYELSDVRIKWPNDIFIGSKKVAGILIENTVKQESVEHAIVGIGLNVNQTSFDKSLPHATSMALSENGKTFDLDEVLNDFCVHFERRYRSYRVTGELAELEKEYLRYLFRKDEEANYMCNGQMHVGIVKGVDKRGRLALEIDRELNYFDLKEIAFVI